jgi:hypothetical protein
MTTETETAKLEEKARAIEIPITTKMARVRVSVKGYG